MIIPSPKSRTFWTNSLFAAFSLAITGWGLLHAWGLSIKMGILFHALAAVPGLVLSGAVLYRYRWHWPVNATGTSPDKQGRKLPWSYQAIALYLLLISVGVGIALFISVGSMFLLSVATTGMILVPWAKISVCRDHFFFASTLVQAGALVGLVLLGRALHPLHYPMAAWLLLTVACVLIISVILTHGNRFDRMPVSGYEKTPPSSV